MRVCARIRVRVRVRVRVKVRGYVYGLGIVKKTCLVIINKWPVGD
jgi:hypothetical protein